MNLSNWNWLSLIRPHNKINVIWTKCHLKCNSETRIFKHVYHIKITLQDHTRLQKERIIMSLEDGHSWCPETAEIRKYPVSGNIRNPEISGIRKYLVSGNIWYPEISGIGKHPVSANIQNPEISGIRKYPVSGNIWYPEISSIRKYPKSGKI